MKTIQSIFFFLCLSAAFLVSCENEQLEGEFSATGDGSVIGSPDPSSATCQEAFEVLTVAQVNFATATEANYANACGAYSAALQAVIELCGDSSGALQTTLTGLGNCTEPNACLQAQIASDAALTALNGATSENEQQLCEAYGAALSAQIAACGDPSGNLQTTIDTLNCGGECGVAQIATAEAQEIFDNVDGTDADAYTATCTDLFNALQSQIISCGDADGALQARIEVLGDCTPPEDDGPVRFTMTNGSQKNFNTASVSISGSLLTVVATDVSSGDVFVFDIVLQQVGDNVMQNTTITIDGVTYAATPSGSTPFVNTITENTGSVIVGTFSGTFTAMGGTTVLTANGILDIAY